MGGAKRVAAFTAMSIDAALVFPHPHFPQVLCYFFFLYFLCATLAIETFANLKLFSGSSHSPSSSTNSQNFKLFLPRPYEKSAAAAAAAPPHFPTPRSPASVEKGHTEKEKFARESFIFEPIMTVWQKSWLL